MRCNRTDTKTWGIFHKERCPQISLLFYIAYGLRNRLKKRLAAESVAVSISAAEEQK